MLALKSLGFAAVAAAALTTAPALAAPPASGFSDLYVFGDSLVDAGNISIITGGSTPNEALGYFDGRFTNGYDYTDLISIRLFGAPTTASLAGGNNFAFGGARVVNHGDPIPDLQAQLGAYTARIGAGGSADADALYILNLGGNDIFGLLSGNIGGASQADYIAAVASTYAGGVQYLNDLGARNILITGIPNATEPLAYGVDAQLQAALNGLSLDGDTTLYRYSYLNFFNQLLVNPGAHGLPPLNLGTTCIQAQAQANGCAGIFSFDGTHPTAAIHRAVERDIRAQFGIAAIPEPATWATMILGFGMAGSALRRSRKQVTVPAAS